MLALTLTIVTVSACLLCFIAIVIGGAKAGAGLMRDNEELRRDNAALVARIYQITTGGPLRPHHVSDPTPSLVDPPPTPATSFFVTRKPTAPR